jgi:hypothetical protein
MQVLLQQEEVQMRCCKKGMEAALGVSLAAAAAGQAVMVGMMGMMMQAVSHSVIVIIASMHSGKDHPCVVFMKALSKPMDLILQGSSMCSNSSGSRGPPYQAA